MHHFSLSVIEVEVDLGPAGTGRMVVALAVLGLLGVAAWFTMDAGRYRTLTFVLLAFFAFRVVIGKLRSR